MPQVTPEGFAHMTKLLMDAVPGGRVILALEVGVREARNCIKYRTRLLPGRV
jgi:hypothetical protein